MLNITKGRYLNFQQEIYDKAIEEISSAIYIDSLNNTRLGPEDPALVSSYLMMGELCQKFGGQESVSKAVRFYDLVDSI